MVATADGVARKPSPRERRAEEAAIEVEPELDKHIIENEIDPNTGLGIPVFRHLFARQDPPTTYQCRFVVEVAGEEQVIPAWVKVRRLDADELDAWQNAGEENAIVGDNRVMGGAKMVMSRDRREENKTLVMLSVVDFELPTTDVNAQTGEPIIRTFSQLKDEQRAKFFGTMMPDVGYWVNQCCRHKQGLVPKKADTGAEQSRSSSE